MRIFFIGMPGAGKSTLGKAIAQKLAFPFFDLDQIIVSNEDCDITGIFEKYGEDYFRHLENIYLKKLTFERQTFLIATGGGTPCFHGHMHFMNTQGLTVFLNPPVQEVTERLFNNDLINRPLLKTSSKQALFQKVETMLTTRMPFYAKAQMVFEKNFNLENMLAQIVLKLPAEG